MWMGEGAFKSCGESGENNGERSPSAPFFSRFLQNAPLPPRLCAYRGPELVLLI